MIRTVLSALIVCMFAGSALSADWTRYVNARYGAGVDIPPGFTVNGEALAGDGKVFRSGNGRSVVTVWGAHAQAAVFSDEMRSRIGDDEAQGWAITYRSETPDWAAWGGTRAGHVFYAKSIATCGGRQTANVRLIYPAADIPDFDAIAIRLGRSLAQDGACF